MVSFDGEPVTSWSVAQDLIRDHRAGAVDVVVERNGQELTLTPVLITTERRALGAADEDGYRAATDELVTVGFLGIAPTQEFVPEDVGGAVTWLGDFTAQTATAVVSIPQKMVGVWQAAFGGEERDLTGPIGIVGAGRIGGEIATAEVDVDARIATSSCCWRASTWRRAVQPHPAAAARRRPRGGCDLGGDQASGTPG